MLLLFETSKRLLNDGDNVDVDVGVVDGGVPYVLTSKKEMTQLLMEWFCFASFHPSLKETEWTLRCGAPFHS